MVSSYQPLLLTILICFLGSILFDSSAALGGVAKGWTPIKNLRDAKVVDIGKFAVAKHNSQAKTGLVFENLVNGETQVGAGTEYNLTITAKDSDGSDTVRNYIAVVFDRPSQNFLELVSFRGPV